MLNSGVSLQRLATKAGVGFTPKKLFSNGEAGVWYDPSDVEASLTWRRNLLEYTESFDNSYYTGYFQKPTFTTGQADPLGGNNAMKWNASTTTGSSDGAKGGFYRPDNDGIIKPNTDYTVSVWLKATAPIAVSVGLMDGGYTTVTATTSWQRFSVTVQKSTNPVHGSRLIQIVEHTNADVDIYIFGAQTEEGSTATEYQPIQSEFKYAFMKAFPKHTLFQEFNTNTPVTELGQPAGLMLDKSQGIAFSDNIVVNGTFDTDASWGKGDGWSISGGTASCDGTQTANSSFKQQNTTLVEPIVAGAQYQLTFTISNHSGGGVNPHLRNQGTGTYITGDGTYQLLLSAGSGNDGLNFYVQSSFVGSIDDVTLVKVEGSHATQSDSTKRPVFARHPERGRVNLLKYTEEFDNGYWTKGTNAVVTANYGVAPNGTQTADRLELPATGSTFISGLSNLPVNNGSVYTFSVYVKATSGTSNFDLYYNFGNTIQVGEQTATSEWQRFDYTVTASATTGTFGINNAPDTYASDILIWGAQLEEANEATGYQKVVDDYDITESGYKSVYYLQFDGVNDAMKIPPLTSSVKPLTAVLGYSATNFGANAHRFLLDIATGRTVLGSNTDGTYFSFGYHDGTWRTVSTVDPNAIKVMTYDLVANDAKMRENGIQFYSDTTYDEDAVSGDIGLFGRYTLDDHFVAGNLYQFVLRAEESTDKEIDQAEEFVAIKTGLKSEVVGLATLDLNFGANTYTARNSNGSAL